MLDDWRTEQRYHQQLDDLRAFQIVQAVLRVRDVWTRGRTSINPGDLFPSLKEIAIRDDDGDEIDPEVSFQQFRAAFSQFERR